MLMFFFLYFFLSCADDLEHKKEHIKSLIGFSWKNYAERAFGRDGLDTLSGSPIDLQGLGTFLVDNLDTLWLSGHFQEFEEAVKWVKKRLKLRRDITTNVGEGLFRIVGGLLSGYALTSSPHLLEKAAELSSILLHAYPVWSEISSNSSRYPDPDINLFSLKGEKPSEFVTLADLSAPLELNSLSALTGECAFAHADLATLHALLESEEGNGLKLEGLAPQKVSIPWTSRLEGQAYMWNNFISTGSRADRFFWGLCSSMNSVRGSLCQTFIHNALRASPGLIESHPLLRPDGLGGGFVASPVEIDVVPGEYFLHRSNRQESLTCFLPAIVLPYKPVLAYQLVAKCVEAQEFTQSGLMPEVWTWEDNGVPRYTNEAGEREGQIRGTLMKTLFILLDGTEDPRKKEMIRDIAWEAVESFERGAKTEFGFSSVKDVSVTPLNHTGIQHTHIVSEFLKFAFLIFDQQFVENFKVSNLTMTSMGHFVDRNWLERALPCEQGEAFRKWERLDPEAIVEKLREERRRMQQVKKKKKKDASKHASALLQAIQTLYVNAESKGDLGMALAARQALTSLPPKDTLGTKVRETLLQIDTKTEQLISKLQMS